MLAGTDVQPPTTAPEAPAALPVPPERHGLHWGGKLTLAAAPFAFVVLAWGAGAFVHTKISGPATVPPPAVVPVANGTALYAEHCARCHGTNGDGNGVAHLEPKARYFGYEKFKFATTTNGIPTDDDLLRVLRRGIPGSAMPAFDYLPETDLRAIIEHLRRLTRAGIYERMYREGMKKAESGDDDPPDPAVLHARAYTQSLPGQPLTNPGEIGPPSPDVVARGRGVYEKACLSCHGPKGEGDGPQVATMKDELGRPIRPRNLTSGMYKGGGEIEHLYARIMLGIPGTPMPASGTLPAKDVHDLIHYIRSLPPAPPTDAAVMTAAPKK